MTGRQGRRRKQLLDDSKKTGGYYKSKEEVLDRTVWTCHKTDYGMSGVSLLIMAAVFRNMFRC